MFLSNAKGQDVAVAGGASADLPPDAIRAQLERVLASDGFINGPKLGQFLDYVVRQSLARFREFD